MIRFLTLAVLVVGAAFTRADDQNNASSYEGTYVIVSGERDGRAIPKEEIEGAKVVIKEGKILGTDKDKKEFFACTYTVDSTSKPPRIAMTSTAPKVGEKASGVIKKEGDTVKICYGLPGGETPSDFSAGKMQQCFVLKKKD